MLSPALQYRGNPKRVAATVISNSLAALAPGKTHAYKLQTLCGILLWKWPLHRLALEQKPTAASATLGMEYSGAILTSGLLFKTWATLEIRSHNHILGSLGSTYHGNWVGDDHETVVKSGRTSRRSPKLTQSQAQAVEDMAKSQAWRTWFSERARSESAGIASSDLLCFPSCFSAAQKLSNLFAFPICHDGGVPLLGHLPHLGV